MLKYLSIVLHNTVRTIAVGHDSVTQELCAENKRAEGSGGWLVGLARPNKDWFGRRGGGNLKQLLASSPGIAAEHANMCGCLALSWQHA